MNHFSKTLKNSVNYGILLGMAICGKAIFAERPNVLFIAIDDLVPTVGAYGDPHAITPAMDTLAAKGTTFRNHHVQWPVCGPSRAALTTGLLPEETGVMGFKPIRAILPGVTTLPQHFRNNGYETAATGKFHDPRTVGTIVDPDSKTLNGREVDDVASWSIPYVNAAGGYNPPGKPAVDNSDLPDADYGDHAIMVEGKQLLDTLENGDKSFFLAVGFKKPHLPFVAPKKYWDIYDRNQFTLPEFQELPTGASSPLTSMLGNNSELLGYEPFDVTGMPSEAEQLELIHGYYACASFIDALIEELLAHLSQKDDPVHEGRKMSETTIIVVWGDHGFHLGDHNRWAKHSVMERATFAPLIIYDPRNPTEAAHSFAPVNTVDIYPTLCEMAALPVPEQPLSDTELTGRPLRGRSLVPILKDSSTSVNDGAISLIQRSGSYGYAYRTERFRYIEWVNNSNVVVARDLFDYKEDPLETKNLIRDPRYATLIYQFSRSMRAEPTTQGSSRLQDSDPIPATGAEIDLGEGYVPDVELKIGEQNGQALLDLKWLGMRGISYDIIRNFTLGNSEWVTHIEGVSGSSKTFPLEEDRIFLRVRLGRNHPPLFRMDPLLLSNAKPGIPYSESLLSLSIDPDSGDTLKYNKLEGPDWLVVNTDGSVSGMPSQLDVGSQFFRVSVNDPMGAQDVATLNIQVIP